MQDLVQAQTLPFVKLAQSNMELLTRFSTSPEVVSQTTLNAAELYQRATESAMKLMQSGAFAQLVQGMMKNYTEFLAELGQSGTAVLMRGQAALIEQTQQMAQSAVEVADGRTRRSRQA